MPSSIFQIKFSTVTNAVQTQKKLNHLNIQKEMQQTFKWHFKKQIRSKFWENS